MIVVVPAAPASVVVAPAAAAPRVIVRGATISTHATQRPLSALAVPKVHPAVAIREPSLGIVATGFRGERGPAGRDGDVVANLVSRLAGDVIQSLRMVRSDGVSAFPIDTGDDSQAEQVLGLALQSVTDGSAVQILIGGRQSAVEWSWSAGPIWCGPAGELTQTPASDGWLMQVARAVSATEINIDILPPIYRD